MREKETTRVEQSGEQRGVTEVLVGAAAVTTVVKQSIDIAKTIKGRKDSDKK